MLTILLKLVAAHLIGDFLFQSGRLCQMKYSQSFSVKVYALSIHSLIQAALSYLLIGVWHLWIVPLVIFISHFAIDFIKVQYGDNRFPSFIIDQIAHFCIIGILWYSLLPYGIYISTYLPLSFWCILTAYIAILSPASILIKSFIEYEGWSPNEPSLKGLPNAGKWIGYLERILILTFIFTDNVEGIGFLLAAKSVFRFGELNRAKDIKVTEYVLIGTFMSFTIAIIIGFGVKHLIIHP